MSILMKAGVSGFRVVLNRHELAVLRDEESRIFLAIICSPGRIVKRGRFWLWALVFLLFAPLSLYSWVSRKMSDKVSDKVSDESKLATLLNS